MIRKLLIAAVALVAAGVLWDLVQPVPAIVPRTMMDGTRFSSVGDTAIFDYAALGADSIVMDSTHAFWGTDSVPAWEVTVRVWRADSLVRVDKVMVVR